MKKLLLIFCCALFQLSHGQSIWTNPITDVNPSATNPYSNGDVKNANITVSGIRRSASVNAPATTPNIFTATGWRGAFNVLRYYEFSMSPQSGYKINFINFSFNTGTTGASQVTNFELRSSIDGFEYPIGTVVNGANTISLSDSDFQNVTSTVVFRIYAWGAANNGSSFGITDFTFNGNVVVNGTPSQSIWTNVITDTNPSFSNPYTTSDVKDANITVSGIRRGSGLVGFSVADRYDAIGWPNANLNVNDYYEFTLTPNSSYKINLQSFVFDGQTSGATAPNKFALQSSLDNYTSQIVVVEDLNIIDLSNAIYQNLTAPITFRLYAWGATDNLGRYGINSFTFNGTTTVDAQSDESIWSNPIINADPSASNPFTAGSARNPNITVSGIARGTGILPRTTVNRYDATGWDSSSLDTNDYYQFTLTPNSGFKINLNSFVFDGQVASASAPTNFALRSSLDGYSGNIGIVQEDSNTIDLTNTIYQNLASPITFRLYAWGATASDGRYGINSFQFKGNVVASSCVTPTITTTGIIDSVCFNPTSTTTVILPYTATTGNPVGYSIDWNVAASAAGLIDQSNSSQIFNSGSGNVNIVIAANIPVGTYEGVMTIGTGSCIVSQVVSLTVLSNTASAGSASPTVCLNSALTNITHTTTGATGIGTATGLPAGVSAAWSSDIITISGTPSETGTFNYSIPLTGGCGSINATGTIIVSPNVTPLFSPLTNLCFGESIPPLPVTSINGITGTWSPALNNTATTTYTFTPNAGQCGTTATLTIIVRPAFTAGEIVTLGEFICIGGDPTLIGSVTPASGGDSGIIYRWSSSTDGINYNAIASTNSATYDPPSGLTVKTWYRREARDGSCNTNFNDAGNLSTGVWIVDVSAILTPTFTAVAPICSGATLSALPTTSNNGITGTWSPALNNTTTTTYTFTPDSGQCGTTTTLSITVNPSLPASVSIVANPVSAICAGDNVTFTATPTNGGTTPTYQWKVNGSDVAGETGATFSTTSLANNDAVSVVMTSNATCATGSPATSNEIVKVVFDIVVPSVSVSPTSTTICTGGSVTFTATPTNGGTPSYQWKLNGTDVSGETAATFTSNSLANNDVVTVVMTSSLPFCLSTPTATSTGIIMTVNPSLPASVSIVADPVSAICAGDNVTFTATPTNGGTTPTYQWKVNGSDVVGETGATFSTTSLANNDAVSVVMTSNATCAIGSPATSNEIVKVVFDIVVPSVSVSPTSTTICTGGSVTFTATPTNGGTPSYQWKLNGTDVSGETAATFTSNSLANNDVVTVVMTSSLPFCLSTPTATSTGIIMTVNPSLPASVSIVANPISAICAGDNVTFTATPTNGGTTPTYQWKVNGSDVAGQTGATFSTTSLANNDSVSVVMTSNATCATGSPATSNAIVKVVFDIVVPSVSVSATSTTICTGASVTFTATPTNGGTPSYQWKLNGTDVSGETAATFTSNSLANNDIVTVVMTSSLPFCLSTPTATSTGITITVNPNVTPTFTAVAPICSGATLSALPTTSNNGITGTWSPALNNTATTTYTFTPTAGLCATTATLTITVNPLPTAPTAGTVTQPTCAVPSGSFQITGFDGNRNYIFTPAVVSISPTGLVTATTGTYTFTVDNAAGCNSLASASIVVNAALTAPTAPTVGTITNASCAGTGSVVLSGLPSGAWTITQSGTFNASITGSGTSTTIAALGIGSYTFSVNDGVCSSVTTAAVVIEAPQVTTWNGSTWSNGTPTTGMAAIISGNYSQAADITACSLTVNTNAVVSIPSGFNVYLDGILTVTTGSSFTLENNANLVQTVTTPNSGNIIVKRNTNPLMRFDYTAWSSPVEQQGLLAFSPLTSLTPAVRFYTYTTSTNLYTSIGTPAINNATFNTGRGYLIRMPFDHPTAPTVWNGSFTGRPFNGSIILNLANDADPTKRFNFIGNPYPSTMSIATFAAANSTRIEPTLYFWRKTNNELSPSYCTVNTASNVFTNNGEAFASDPQGVIQIGQGFFVQAKAGATVIDFENTQRIANNNNQFFRSSASATTNLPVENNTFWLNMTGNGTAFSQTAIGYYANATQGIDEYDSNYFNDGVIAFTSSINNKDFAIQGRAPFNPSDVVPMKYKVTAAGVYSIAIDHTQGMFNQGAQTIYVRDNLNNTYHNLNTGAYTFSSNAGSFEGRFDIVYQAPLSTDDFDFTSNTISIYNQDSVVYLKSSSTPIENVKVFDIRGRLLVQKENINSTETQLNLPTANQVLLVEITSTEGVKVIKKIAN